MSVTKVIKYFKEKGSPEIAEHSKRFFKTGKGEYGYGDKFIGVRVPVLRKGVKDFKDLSLGEIEKVLHSKYHEVRLFALFLLVYRFSKIKLGEQQAIFDLYLRNTDYVNNWDLVDSSAHQIVGGYLFDKDRSILYNLAVSDSLWERRIAIITCYHFIKRDDYKDCLNLAKILIDDSEDLIHKAVGWMLREVGNRSKQTEEKFLAKHYKKMPRTMLRYAIERFSAEERKSYLQGEA